VTPLPPPLAPLQSVVVAWRLDTAQHASTWDSGEGARLFGGRWNSKGTRAVYASLDPSTCILEVAVHTSLSSLDGVPRALTSFSIKPSPRIKVIYPQEIPDQTWLGHNRSSSIQQAFGDEMLSRHGVLVLPSVVSRHSWNLLFDPLVASGLYQLETQEPFKLDPRLTQATH
jgi:RES domain-containing protein